MNPEKVLKSLHASNCDTQAEDQVTAYISTLQNELYVIEKASAATRGISDKIWLNGIAKRIREVLEQS